MFVPGVRFPDVPTLVVAAELDLSTTEADGRFVADLFPRSRFVLLRNGGHTPGFYSQCSPPLYLRFVNTLKTGDTSCVERGDADRPAPGRFPRRARGAHPAKRRSSGADRSRRIDRRVAAVAWLTVQDALRLNGLVPSQKVRGVGLRGGGFVGVFHPDEVAVTSRSTAGPGSTSLTAVRFGRESAWTVQQAPTAACDCAGTGSAPTPE